LGEDAENYLIRITSATSGIREFFVEAPSFEYLSSEISSDAASAPFEIEVAQVSSQFGPGPVKRIVFDG